LDDSIARTLHHPRRAAIDFRKATGQPRSNNDQRAHHFASERPSGSRAGLPLRTVSATLLALNLATSHFVGHQIRNFAASQ
jgi:hypothetical protein